MGIIVPPPASLGQFLYDFVFYFSYFFVGIVGVVLLISGLLAFFGVHIKPAATPPQAEGTETPADCSAPKCKKCGKELPDGYNFCPHCGKKFVRKSCESINKGLIIAVVILSCLLIISLVAYNINAGKKDAIIQEQNLMIEQMSTELSQIESVAKSLCTEAANQYMKGHTKGSQNVVFSRNKLIDIENELLRKYGLD